MERLRKPTIDADPTIGDGENLSPEELDSIITSTEDEIQLIQLLLDIRVARLEQLRELRWQRYKS